jgi:hypothetical protein
MWFDTPPFHLYQRSSWTRSLSVPSYGTIATNGYGVSSGLKRYADDEDICISGGDRLMVSLAGLLDFCPTLFAAFPSASHETHFLA